MRLKKYRRFGVLERKSETCARAGGVGAIRMLRAKDRFLLSTKIMKEIGKEGFAKKFEAAAMKEIFDEEVLELAERKQVSAELVLDLLKQAVDFGIGTEDELARRAFRILRKKGNFITKLAEIARMNEAELKKQEIFFALAHDFPMSDLQADGAFWDHDINKDKEVQKAVRKTIKKKIKKGDYGRAAEIAFAFGQDGIADGIERSCKELGIPFGYVRYRLEEAII